MNWLIWSIEHNAWWAPKENGYVLQRRDAGRYSYEDALRIVKEANRLTELSPNEAMVLDD